MDTKKTGLIIGIIGVVVLVILIGIFIVPAEGPQPPKPDEISPTVTAVESFKKQTYREFLSSGKSEICNFLIHNGDQISVGTVYTANGKIKSEFTLTGVSGTVQQHLLVDAYTAYMWTNVNNSGIKFIVQEQSEDKLLRSSPSFDCKSWTPTASIFDIPPNIIFTEITGF